MEKSQTIRGRPRLRFGCPHLPARGDVPVQEWGWGGRTTGVRGKTGGRGLAHARVGCLGDRRGLGFPPVWGLTAARVQGSWGTPTPGLPRREVGIPADLLH